MGYINSDNIVIFPSSNRTNSKNYGTNWLTEYNISNIVNQLLGSFGFVISDKTTEKPFKFNIKGYYIELSDAADILTDISNSGETINIDGKCTLVYFRKFRDTEDSKYKIVAGIKFSEGNPYGFQYIEGKDGGDGETVTNSIPKDTEALDNELVLFQSNDDKDITALNDNVTIPQNSRINIKHLSELIKSLDNPTITNPTINNGYLSGTFGPTGSGATLKNMSIESSTFSGTSYVSGTFGPTGSGNITATKIKGGNVEITAKTATKDNIGLLFCIDDGEI